MGGLCQMGYRSRDIKRASGMLVQSFGTNILAHIHTLPIQNIEHPNSGSTCVGKTLMSSPCFSWNFFRPYNWQWAADRLKGQLKRRMGGRGVKWWGGCTKFMGDHFPRQTGCGYRVSQVGTSHQQHHRKHHHPKHRYCCAFWFGGLICLCHSWRPITPTNCRTICRHHHNNHYHSPHPHQPHAHWIVKDIPPYDKIVRIMITQRLGEADVRYTSGHGNLAKTRFCIFSIPTAASPAPKLPWTNTRVLILSQLMHYFIISANKGRTRHQIVTMCNFLERTHPN